MSKKLCGAARRRKLKSCIFIRDKNRCFYCNKELTYKQSTLDHIIPRSQGGFAEYNNLVLACFRCNNDRGIMPADQFLIMIYAKAR